MAQVYALKHPFAFGDRQVTELTFDRLKGKHLRKMGATPTMDDLLTLASKSAKEPPALFDEMDAADVVEVSEVIGAFLGGSPPTGGSA
jgi:Phage tail assembly chaperone proteins, E, or 41 or 14